MSRTITMTSNSEDILGHLVFNKGVQACIAELMGWLNQEQRRCRSVSCTNAYSFNVARKDAEFHRALATSDWLIPDGVGIVWASRMLGGRMAGRVTGSDVFWEVMDRLNAQGKGSVFFLGSTEDTLQRIRAKVAVDYPNVRLAGTLSPPFKPEYTEQESAEMIRAINASGADVLWVGMTAPKQEKWIQRHKDQLTVKMAAGIGAVFDFYSGKTKRSHPLLQKFGMEWLSRLLRQPRRVLHRFPSIPILLLAALSTRIRMLMS